MNNFGLKHKTSMFYFLSCVWYVFIKMGCLMKEQFKNISVIQEILPKLSGQSIDRKCRHDVYDI